MLRRFVSVSFLAASLCSQAIAAPEQWIQVSSEHFTVVTDSNDKQGRHILDQFERMRWLFHTLFPKSNVDPAVPIIVIAARNQKGFEALEPAAYLTKGQLSLAGYFLRTPDKNYVLLRMDAEGEHPFATIYHEYTHLQFSSALEWLPLWLNEGFAEFFQNTEIHSKDALVGQPSVEDILYLRQNKLLPLDTLFKVDANSPYYHEEKKGSVFYAESWALTHYLEMTDHEKGTHRLSTYISLVSQHEDPLAAGEKAFGDLKQLQSSLQNYIQASSYKQFVLSSAAAPLDEASYKSKALSQTEADAIRADCLVYVKRTQDARLLLDAVLKSNPNNVQAQETMGYLAFQDGDQETARKWYGQAVKLDSQSYLAHYYFAVMSMNSDEAAHNPEIEASLRAAIRLNPLFAPAYDQLAALLAMRHEKLDEAHILNVQAVQLDPANLVFRINTASVLMTMERYSDAVFVLRGAVKVASNPGEVAMVENRIKEIESIQALGAHSGVVVSASSQGEVTLETAEKVVAVDLTPKHPTEPANGTKHLAVGVIRGVKCSYPAILEFQVDNGKKQVSLYTNNFTTIDLTVLDFTPKGSMNPCSDFEGMKAKVQYAETSDKTVDGQVIAVELRK
jgi:tetratricopeptide (TPR) repeat protein